MTRLLISTALAGLLALGGAGWAQDRDDHRDRGGRGQQATPPAAPAPHIGGGPANTPRGPSSGGFTNFGNGARAVAPPNGGGGPGPSNAMRGPQPGNDVRGPNNNLRGQASGNDRRGPAFDNDRRRDFSSLHRNFNAPRRFRAQIYQRPRGWYAHRWTYGEILPSLFWAPDFWLDDYFDYGLAPPPPGTVWVRDGDDALLIDRFSGEIIQVAYGVFY